MMISQAQTIIIKSYMDGILDAGGAIDRLGLADYSDLLDLCMAYQMSYPPLENLGEAAERFKESYNSDG